MTRGESDLTLPSLDDMGKIKALDSQDHFGMVADLPGQLEEAYAAGASVIEEAGGEVGGIAVAGMGGSAIGSDLVANVFDVSLPSPLVTVRGYHLPHWTSSRSLVFTASYSGNTEESLSCLEDALEKGCRTVCLSSGGRMSDIAREQGLPLIHVPPGMQPRAAIGWLSVPIAACLESLGLIEKLTDDIGESVALLRELAGLYGPENPTEENPAKQLARELYGSIPVVYGCELTDVAARRWKCQINENAKNVAFANEFPELNHNEIVGWQNPEAALGSFRLVYLDDKGIHPQNRKRMEITAGMLREYTGEAIRLQTSGDSRLARIFSSICLGDYVSLYLATLGGMDPSPVTRIEDLKRRLA
ncbi:bifunctional phosphoglucose/phosphomannose isomerase [bacterium BMS3Abin01]|nr:bifunctional phosphoglucose/phosphomannose isomerase [bacterium BMS3Abin01]HDY69545.1 bifunctional phosphoglucose/phosphomannose isomerase [Actinomycetota bacterium]